VHGADVRRPAHQQLARASLVALVVLGALSIAWLAIRARLGDYPGDAGPAIAAFVAGDLHRAFAVPFLMGPLSILLRVPFGWVAHSSGVGELGVYRVGVVVCLAAAGGLGVALARASARASGERSWPLLVPLLAIVSPASLAAVEWGHPEEVLGGALAVAAVLLATGGRVTLAGIAFGLAVATKQWALVALAPVLLAAPPRAGLRAAGVAALVVAALYLPFAAGNPGAFAHATRVEAFVIPSATPQSVWLAASHEVRVVVPGSPTLTYHALSRWFAGASHALTVLIGIPLGLLLWRRGYRRSDPLGLLALLFMIRCVLDPDDLEYFYVPFLLALLAWEVAARRLVRGIPVATLVAMGCLWLTFDFLPGHSAGPGTVNVLYLAWSATFAWFLLGVLRLVPGFAFPRGSHRLRAAGTAPPSRERA
jgi:hypothetical protein